MKDDKEKLTDEQMDNVAGGAVVFAQDKSGSDTKGSNNSLEEFPNDGVIVGDLKNITKKMDEKSSYT